ncbi:family 78 glycoside hydrolase catalytic domain [Novosphingobium sp. PhB57]|uniref:family 78 glycoside hydrolase catalytic domain n=1 Tax=Novosphingobium sp. PhB57 TaxID=2485107 RepID=UPI001405317B|nr:family 78 glycoside hydrolase catalytic domain [Novosphingobium sp. PhB57]
MARDCKVEWRVNPVGIDSDRPRFRWCLDTGQDAGPVRQKAFRIRMIGDVGSGQADQIVSDSGWVRSSECRWRPASALPLRSHSRYGWELAIRVEHGAETPSVQAGHFVTGLMQPMHWNARWIGAEPEGNILGKAVEWRRPIQDSDRMPLLRGQFEEAAPVQAAFLSVIGLGQYTLAINGQGLNDDQLRPAWSHYADSLYYDTFDVSNFLRPGLTVISAMLGDGFFNVEGVKDRYTKFMGSYGRPRLLLQLRMIFADGRERLFCTDDSWSCAAGPVIFSSIYGGEDHDARLEPLGWRETAIPPAAFHPVSLLPPPGGRLFASPLPPMAVMGRLENPKITALPGGALLADFGLNFAGRPHVMLDRLGAGEKLVMKPAELLGVDGHIDQASATGASEPGYKGIAFAYTGSGTAGALEWTPRFTYTGFRYLEMEGVERKNIRALRGDVLHLAAERSGRFACSDEGLVHIHQLIEQAFLSNFASVLTDCPHREKLGWLEQVYLNAPTAFFNRDCAALYEKIGRDMRDAQRDNGMVPSVAPEFVEFVRRDGSDTDFRDSPEWGCAIVLAPWAAYRFYGDTMVLAENFDAMQRYAAYLEGRAVDGLVDFGLGDWFDIGPSKPGKAQLTTRAFTGTATLFAVLATMARIGALLDRPADAALYRRKAAAVKDRINAQFLDPARGIYDRGSQTAQAMALALGIAEPRQQHKVLARLIEDIKQRNYHVSAGDVGFYYLVEALTQTGGADILYAMLKKTDAPSYGAQIAQGATALTEAWDAARHASQNHFMLGHAEAWLFGGLGGIRMDFTRKDAPILIAPQPVVGVEWTDVSLTSVLGDVRCAWRQADGEISIEASVPTGAQADLILPTSPSTHLASSRSMRLGSGRHHFTVPLAIASANASNLT